MSTLDGFDPWTYTPAGKTMALIVASHSPAERIWLLNGENGRQEAQTPPLRVSIQLQWSHRLKELPGCVFGFERSPCGPAKEICPDVQVATLKWANSKTIMEICGRESNLSHAQSRPLDVSLDVVLWPKAMELRNKVLIFTNLFDRGHRYRWCGITAVIQCSDVWRDHKGTGSAGAF